MRELAVEPAPPCKLLLLSDSASAPPKREVPTEDLPRRALAHAEAAGEIGVPPKPDDIVTGDVAAAPEDIVNGVVDTAPEDIVNGVEDMAAAPEDIVNGVVGAAPEAIVEEGDVAAASGASITMGSALIFMFMLQDMAHRFVEAHRQVWRE